MTVWAVFNGWDGNGAVAVIVAADSETDAINQATPVLKQRAHGPHRYPATYWSDLTAEALDLPYECELS